MDPFIQPARVRSSVENYARWTFAIRAVCIMAIISGRIMDLVWSRMEERIGAIIIATRAKNIKQLRKRYFASLVNFCFSFHWYRRIIIARIMVVHQLSQDYVLFHNSSPTLSVCALHTPPSPYKYEMDEIRLWANSSYLSASSIRGIFTQCFVHISSVMIINMENYFLVVSFHLSNFIFSPWSNSTE